jgi:1-acyl-sn-glycerol-3-phosphate acyltransferase
MSLELTDPREKKRYYLSMTPARRVLTPAAEAIFTLLASTEYRDLDYLPDYGPVIVAANHLTNFDVFPMQFVLPRPIFFMGKEELFRNPLLDWVLRQLGGFPVYRGERDEWALRHAARVLESGQVLGIFPEGKRSKGQGLMPAKSGAARLALVARCPIVPVAVYGTQQIAQKFPRRSRVSIRLGPPVYPGRDESALSLTDRLMFSLAELLPAEARGVYARRPVGF